MKGIIIDVRTQKEEVIEDGQPDPLPEAPAKMPKGINPEKLKALLKAKGIIASDSEVE